jgi:methylornithine synthase
MLLRSARRYKAVNPLTNAQLDQLLDKAANGGPLTRTEIEGLLTLADPEQIKALMAAARRVRRRYFGGEVFLYGFLYASTFCRNHCRFCLYRKDNPEAPRYRKSQAEMIGLAGALAESGVHLIDLTMGEDPETYALDGSGFEALLETMGRIRTATGLPMMASVGVLPPAILARLAELGVEWYACYQETHTPDLYRRLRSGQGFDQRLQSKRYAGGMGLLVEEGVLTGVGETPADLVHSLEAMTALGADQVRAMTFVPQAGTPMAGGGTPLPSTELKLIALMRLVMPDCLIPASLDIEGLSGLAQRLAAGANVVTSLVPPGEGLAGVAQSELDIDAGKRTVAGIQETLAACGLRPADAAQYRAWVASRQRMKCGAGRDTQCAS